MTFVGSDRPLEAGALPVGEVLSSGPQDGADPLQRVALTAAVAEGLLLDPAVSLVDGLGAEFDYVDGIDDGDGALELVIDGVLLPLERVEGGHREAGAEVLARSVSQSR